MRTFQCHAYASCPVNSSIRHCARRTRLSNQSRIPYDQQQQQHRQQQQQQQQAAIVSTAVTSSDAEPPRDHAAQREVPEGIAEPMSEEAVASEKQRHKKLWFAAVKPPMYTVSIVPILVGIDCIASVCGTENVVAGTPQVSMPLCAGFCCSCICCFWDTVAQQVSTAELSLHSYHCLAQPQVCNTVFSAAKATKLRTVSFPGNCRIVC